MYFDSKATDRFLRRRHKLYKAITTQLDDESKSVIQQESKNFTQIQTQQFQKVFINILQLFLEKNFEILPILELMNKQAKILSNYKSQFLETILSICDFQSGHKVAYVSIQSQNIQIIYRFCKQNPYFFTQFVKILEKNLTLSNSRENHQFSLEKCIFFTDLFLYGFFFTAKTFMNSIFFHSERFIIDYVILLPPINQWYIFLARKHVFKLNLSAQNWINQAIRQIKIKFENLKSLENQIQKTEVQKKKNHNNKDFGLQQKQDQQQKQNSIYKEYIKRYEQYQNNRQKLQYLQKDQGISTPKNIEKIIKQCDFYQPEFKLPELLYKLYKSRQIPKMEIKSIKKNQMISIFDDEAFLTQLRICGSIENAVDLSSYFLANLSTQSNREQLIEFIIDYCHNESNLDLIMKIIAQISCEYPQMAQYLNKKAHKITSQIKMNKKYLNLLCEGIKYQMIDSVIILEYIQKRLISEHTQMNILETIRESCHILQLLGQGIYHESLKTNIFINNLFELIEQKIKQKKLSIQFVFNLKCVKNYLRKPHILPEYLSKSPQILQNQTLSQLAEFNLKQHFDLILKRIKQLLNSKPNNKTQQNYSKNRILNYLIQSIENQSNFIQTFFEASLIKDLNHKEIRQDIIQKCIQKIQSNIHNNIQQASKWSRFLGELYNYQIINRKRLSQILEGKLLFCGQLNNEETFQSMVKCVLQCLNISKSYIVEIEQIKDNNQYILNFLIKFKRSILKHLELKNYNKGFINNIIIEHQIQDIFQYFHPVLIQKLKSVNQIDKFCQKVKFSSTKDSLLSLNLHKIFSYYLEVQHFEEFDSTLVDGPIKKSKQQQSNSKKSGKKQVYKQKLVQQQDKIRQIQIAEKKQKQLQKQKTMQQKIEEINLNYRNQQQQSLPEEQQQILRQQGQNLQKQLKQMMGITPQIQMNQKFPQLREKNFKKQKNPQQNAFEGNFKKILRDEKGKKMKIIGRKKQQI